MKKLILALLLAASLSAQAGGFFTSGRGGGGCPTCATVTGTPAVGDIPSANNSTTFQLIAAGAVGTCLVGNGALTVPSFQACGTGTVSTVSVTTANGVSGSVANATTTPAITITLGAITPSSVVSSGAVSGTALTASALLTFSGVEDNITAGTTQTQAGATALSTTASFHRVTTAANNDGVRLPVVASGEIHWVINASGNVLKVYPATGEAIAGLGANAATSFQSEVVVGFIGLTAGKWRVLATNNFTNGNNVTMTQSNGVLSLTSLTNKAWSTTAPTVASGGCTTPGAITQNGTFAFSLASVGTGCSGSQPLVFTLSAATTGWLCVARNVSNGATSSPAQTGALSTTSVTITNFVRTTGVAGAWTDADVIQVACHGE